MRIKPGAVVLTLIAVAMLAAAAPGAAGSAPARDVAGARAGGLPKLLTEPYSNDFAVRPGTVYIAGEGSSLVGDLQGKGGTIHWSEWTGTGARGVGTYWLDDFIPSAAEGTYHPHRAVVTVSRVRHGRFTRMVVRFRGGSRVWDPGSSLYVEHHRLTRLPEWFVWD
jgi:hypothetical protein